MHFISKSFFFFVAERESEDDIRRSEDQLDHGGGSTENDPDPGVIDNDVTPAENDPLPNPVQKRADMERYEGKRVTPKSYRQVLHI